MTTFAYSTGNPDNLDNSDTASMADIKGPFDDFKTFVNGANIDSTNLATSADPVTLLTPYLTVCEVCFILAGANGANSVWWPSLSQAGTTPMTTTQTPYAVGITNADFAVSGLTPKMRLSVAMAVNSTAPGINFIFGLYPITSGGAGGWEFAEGTVVSGSTVTKNTPTADTISTTQGSDFSLPSNGAYAIGVQVSGTQAAGCLIHGNTRLEVHWV